MASTKIQDEHAPAQFVPVAVCGMGLRVPGGVHHPEELWQMLMTKGEGRSIIPDSRFNESGFYSEHQPKQGTINFRHGYFLDEALHHFDAGFFSMSRREVERLDPQQRLLLEVVHECMESAGETGWRGKNIGCMVGTFGQDWQELAQADKLTSGLYTITGQGDFLLANRVSFEYDLKGPSLTVKTACSSAAVAFHLACAALARRECEGVLVCGSSVLLSPGSSAAMTEQGLVSPAGRSRPLDAAADGYARAEAVGAVYLRRLDDALRAPGTPVRAVVRGSALNCDGRSASLASPSAEAHEVLIRRAYEAAGLEPDAPYVECHGTGTQVGDPLETAAIARVFGNLRGTYLGSIKANIGHSEGASFLTSLIKAVLSLEKKVIPPNLHFSTPNPKIPFQESKLFVPLEPTPWPQGREERASINSFGLGGANAHIILDSFSSYSRGLSKEIVIPNGVEQNSLSPTSRGLTLLVFSANGPESLEDMVHRYTRYVEANPDSLHDLAYTLAMRRDAMRYRSYLLLNRQAGEEPADILGSPVKATPPPPVSFVFTGQGAQWPQMGLSLLEEFPVFAERMAYLDKVLEKHIEGPKWTIQEELAAPASSSRIDEAEFSQPLCTAVQIGLVDLWRDLGVVPDSVVGHSSGEIAAAYAAGAIAAEEAIVIAYLRGQACKTSRHDGAMLAIGLGPGAVLPLLADGAVLTCENSSASVTVSGSKASLNETARRVSLHHPDVLVRRLHVQHAYHSHHMRGPGEVFLQKMSSVLRKPRAPPTPFFSSTHGGRLQDGVPLDGEYWRLNLESPVRFHGAVCGLLRDLGEPGHRRVMLEIGPHSALAGPLRQTFKDTGNTLVYVPSLVRHRNATVSFLDATGRLWACSAAPRLKTLYPRGQVLTDLPQYPWHHKEIFWEENRIARQWRMRKELPHEILGSPVLEWNDTGPTWRNILTVEDVPWIGDHRIGHDVVVPAVGYICMVGEALRQLGGSTAYSLRNIVVGNAMVVDGRVEVMTVLRRAQLTTTQKSDWFDFSISSLKNSTWTENCRGQAFGGRSAGYQVDGGMEWERQFSPSHLPTIVDSGRWYAAMERIGLVYSGKFRSLENVRADPRSHMAVATVRDSREATETRYQLHPSTMDNVLQLLTVAMARGQPRLLKTLAVPTFIAHVYVGNLEGRHGHAMQAQVRVEPGSEGGMIGTGVAYDAEGGVAFEVGGLKASPIDRADVLEIDPHAAVQLDWKPVFGHVDAARLIRTTKNYTAEIMQLEKLFVLCAIDTMETLAHVQRAVPPHLRSFRAWLDGFVRELRTQGSLIFHDAPSLPGLPSEARLEQIQELYKELLGTEMSPYAIAVNRNRLCARDIFQGDAEPLDVLMQDNNLHKIYDFLCFWDYRDLLQLLGHNNPTMRVLEIGAGTGGSTAALLTGLRSDFGERLYARYSYTDISPGFFTGAQERFKSFEAVEFKVLDISQDPVAQGFEEASYDLILAANVLHATPRLGETLANVRKLLRPGGCLLLQELNPTAKCVNFIFGMLPGWWLGQADGRAAEPYVSPDRWRRELQAAGFLGTGATVCYDNKMPFQINATIVATARTLAAVETNGPMKNKTITFLHRGETTALERQYEDAFKAEGFDVEWCRLAEPHRDSRDIVSLVELETPFLDGIGEPDFQQLIAWIATLRPGHHRVLWATRCTQMGCGADPRFAQILGLARNVRTELSVDFATVELDDPHGTSSSRALPGLFRDFLAQDRLRQNAVDPDYEFVLIRGVPHVGRFHWISINDELALGRPGPPPHEVGGPVGHSHEGVSARLEIGRRGLLQTLRYVGREIPPLRPDEVLVRVGATGLNFKDLLVAMGVVDTPALGVEDASAVGIEVAGTVQAVGSAVAGLRAGDRVMAVSVHCFASHVACREATCARIPDELSFVEAATMPCVFATVIRALLDVGRLEKGQTVLIHSACGGVGLAAIQVCRMVGARIFATVGSPEKKSHLTEMHGIPPSDIFDSRTPSFLPAVMQATRGRGVDLCLNSLSGELLHHSWHCVAEFGTLLEIGKRDLVGGGRISLSPFEDNRVYAGIDLSHIYVRQPQLLKSLLERAVEFFRRGHIRPISPVTTFAANECREMFRYMQKGSHIGKIVLDMNMPPEYLFDGTVSPRCRTAFRPDASYLITGGLGGLGRSTARWMVERGAKSLVFLSRRGLSPSVEAFFAEIEASGCSPILVTGPVETESTVRDAVRRAQYPIAGVVHGAMVLKDHATTSMPYEAWQDVVVPRVTGAWNLHDVLLEARAPLDFFVALGSFSGMCGQPGQANYATSNAFLDAFVQYRQGLGLPASALDMGPISDVGYLADAPAALERMRSASTHALGEREYLDALQLAIARSRAAPLWRRPGTGGDARLETFTNPAVVGVGLRSTIPLDHPHNRLVWRRDKRLSIYRNLEEARGEAVETSAHGDGVKQLLASAGSLSDEQGALATRLAMEIGRTLFGFLMRQEEDIVLDTPLNRLGVDSLVSIELRNWCRRHLHMEVSVMDIMQSSLEELAIRAIKEQLERTKHDHDSRMGRGALNGTLPEERNEYDRILEVKVP